MGFISGKDKKGICEGTVQLQRRILWNSLSYKTAALKGRKGKRNNAGAKESVCAAVGCTETYAEAYGDKNRCLCLLDPAGYCYGAAGGSLQHVICLGAGQSCMIQKPVQLAVIFTAPWRLDYRFSVSCGEDYRGSGNESGD